VALALVTGLQHLPPSQRAVFVLREVLGFSAAEVADMLDTSPPSVNSTLQRARGSLEARRAIPRERATVPSAPAERDLVDRFAEAFEQGDVDTLVTMLTDDVLITMPPEPLEYEGIEAVAGFLRDRLWGDEARERKLIPTRANGQPAFAYYLADPHASVARCFGVLVLTFDGDRISGLTRFGDTGFLPAFGLPRSRPDPGGLRRSNRRGINAQIAQPPCVRCGNTPSRGICRPGRVAGRDLCDFSPSASAGPPDGRYP
jgi:RNA polymerase sigma-70 factor (ECF subfamily)